MSRPGEPLPADKQGLRNLALLMAYDGTDFCGWQRQKALPTIQGSIEKALEKICAHPVTLYGCSRTDAGVHARGHVSNFFTDCRIPCEKLPLALEAYLPDGLICRAACEVEPRFNARFRAKGKQYSYYILNTARSDPYWQRFAHHEKRRLNLAAMGEACHYLLGEHDFAAFQAMGSPAANGTTRRLFAVEILQLNHQAAFTSLYSAADYTPKVSGWNLPEEPQHSERQAILNPSATGEGLLRLVVHGSGFLYNMMRIIAGTLLYVGLEKISPEQIKMALLSGDRNLCGKTLAAKGLCLDKVDYEQILFNDEGVNCNGT